MDKKIKFAAALTALAIAGGGATVALTGCNNEKPHSHTYIELVDDGDTHVLACPDCPDNAVDENSREPHEYVDGTCECGAVGNLTVTDGTESGEHGSISIDRTTAKYGDKVTVTVTPDEGYQVKDLTVNGEGVFGAMNGNTYVFNITENTTIVAEFEKIASSSVNSVITGKKYGQTGNSLAAGDIVTLSASGKADVSAELVEEDGKLMLKIAEIAGANWTVSAEGYAGTSIVINRDTVYSEDIALEYDLMENLCTLWGQSDQIDLSKQNDGVIVNGSGYFQWASTKATYETVAITAKVVKGGFRQGVYLRFKGDNYADDGYVMFAKEQKEGKAKTGWCGAGDGYTGKNIFLDQWHDFESDFDDKELELTLVRVGAKVFVFVNNEYKDMRTLPAEYADKECSVGLFCTNAETMESGDRPFSIGNAADFVGVEVTDATETGAHGTISIDKPSASFTDTVTVTITPDEGYQIKDLTVGGNSVVTQIKYNEATDKYTYSFTVMDDTEVAAEFVEASNVESLELTVNPASGFTANGTTVILEQFGKKLRGTVTDGTVSYSNVTTGAYNAYADFGGYNIKLGTVTVAAPESGTTATAAVTLKFTGSGVEYDGSSASANPATGELTHRLAKADGGAYNNKYDIETIENGGYFAHKIEFTPEMAQAIRDGKRVSMSLILRAVTNNGVSKEIKHVFQNAGSFFGKDGSFRWGLDDDGLGGGNSVFGDAPYADLDSYTDAILGDGLWIVLGYDASTGGLVSYAGTSLDSVHVVKTWGSLPKGIKFTGFGLGNWFGGNSNTDTVSLTVKYGATMEALGMELADPVDVNASVNSETMGSVSCSKNVYYAGERCTVTVRAEEGYFLKSLKIGDGAALTEGWTKNGRVYTYSFIVPEDGATILATLEKSPTANVTINVTGVTLADGTTVKLTAKDDGTVKNWLSGESTIELIPGEYDVFVYGYAKTTITIPADGGTVDLALVETIAYVSDNDTKHEITVDETNKTISISGNGLTDREPNQRKINAEYVISEDIKNSTEITMTFTVKAVKKDGRQGSDWVGSRFGVQIGEGEIGFMVFPRNDASATAADVAKLIPGTNLAVSPDRDGKDEQKWHGNDANMAWLADALYSANGIEFKVVRSGGTISIFAKYNDEWVALDTMGTNGETVGKDDIGKLTIADTVKNEIKFTGSGDNWTFSNIEFSQNESTETGDTAE